MQAVEQIVAREPERIETVNCRLLHALVVLGIAEDAIAARFGIGRDRVAGLRAYYGVIEPDAR